MVGQYANYGHGNTEMKGAYRLGPVNGRKVGTQLDIRSY